MKIQKKFPPCCFTQPHLLFPFYCRHRHCWLSRTFDLKAVNLLRLISLFFFFSLSSSFCCYGGSFCSPCPGTFYVNQAVLELTAIFLPQAPKRRPCWMCQCTRLLGLVFFYVNACHKSQCHTVHVFYTFRQKHVAWELASGMF